MKNIISKVSQNIINQFDQELLLLIKNDILNQKVNINKRIHTNTLRFDTELYQIIKNDMLLIKKQIRFQQLDFAKAS